MFKSAVRRSACDLCRLKRVQCLRVQDSTAPCARCSHTGARCVISASGHPGRPRKQRLINGDIPAKGPALGSADVSPLGGHHASSKLRETNNIEVHAPTGDRWATSGDSSFNFNSPSIGQSPAMGEDMLGLVDHLSSSSQLQGLLSEDDELSAMFCTGQDSNTVFDMDVDPLFDPWKGVLSPTSLLRCSSPTSSLIRFREEMDQRIATIEANYSDPLEVVQGCKKDGASLQPENPAAVLLSCSKEFTDIIQSLTPAGQTYKHSEDALSTEIILLTLSSYLSLMRLFDTMFYTIHEFISKVPPDTFESVKVKSVLRIGGLSSLQDISLKTYATGVIDAIQDQMQTLERCMGIPTEYCLSGGDATISSPVVNSGILSRADRVWLFWAIMTQEDIKSRQGSKSYVESIRANIQNLMKFLDN